MAEPRQLDLKNSKIFFQDGAASPARLEIRIMDGTLTYSRKRNVEYKLNRGNIDYTKEGDDVPMEITIDAWFNALKSQTGNPITITEFLEREGAGSALTSAGGACEPYAVDIIVEVNQNCGTTQDEVITFPDFRFEEIGGDLKAGMLKISGKCNAVKPSSVLTTLP